MRALMSLAQGQLTWSDDVSLVDARQLGERLCAEHPDDVVDAVTLVTTELVTNAAKYARGLIRLTITVDDATVVVRVDDQHPVLPVIVVAPGAGGGFGLGIVDRVSRGEWGTAVTTFGKTVWACIATERPQT
jgi:anti-sigma regulatory factor (Ser/Thr protein kinase)